MNDPTKNKGTTTDAELEAQFNERNKNLKQSLNDFADRIDITTSKSQDSSEQSSMSSGDSNIASHAISTEHSFLDSDWGNNVLDRKLMNSIEIDILAMHSTDPELFENVASKIEETFGQNALV